MRRIVFLLLSLVLTVGFAFAGGEQEKAGEKEQKKQKEGAKQEQEELTMWFWGAPPEHQKTMREVLVEPYNNSQDQYTLKVEFRNTVDKDLNVALMANEGPDIVYGSGPAFVAQYADEGKLEPLDKYSEKFGWKERILDPIYKSGTVDGTLYSLPNSLNTYGVFYNKTLFEKHGWEIPKTIKEMEQIMDEALEEGLYASVTGNMGWKPVNENYASIFINHMGGPDNIYEILQGNKSFNTKEMREAVAKSAEWFNDKYLAGEDYYSLNFDQAMSLLSENKSPFFVGPTLAFQFAATYFPNEQSEIGFFPIPKMREDHPYPLHSIGTTATLSVNANSDNKDAAAAVINRMMTSEFLVNMTERWPGYWGVPLKSIEADLSGMEGLSRKYVTAIQNMMEAVNKGHFGYSIVTFFPPATKDHFVNIENVWEGRVSVEEYMKKADKTFQRELEKGLVPPLPEPDLN
jgi:raffinose/stachyose/melibiose transport system substrate-binding protein